MDPLLSVGIKHSLHARSTDMVIMISYDLNHEKPSAYQDVADMIKRYAKDQRKPLRSQWFVYTDDSARDME